VVDVAGSSADGAATAPPAALAPGPRLELRVLGPLSATLDGRPLDLGAPKQRAVLAILALDAGRVIPTDRFIELLWDDDAPRATATLQTYISNLRRILEPHRRPRDPATVLVTEPPGYRLVLEPYCLDATRMTELAAVARRHHREGSLQDAVDSADTALHLWTGDVLPELVNEPFVVEAAERLGRVHLAAVSVAADARLALGDHTGALAVLEPATPQHPFDEHLHALLALAQYRAGRQADALRTVDRIRRTLAEEAGLDLGPELRSLEADLLAHAPSLDWSPTASEPTMATTPAPGSEPAPAAPGGRARAGAPEGGSDERPLVGRGAELARLVGALDRAMAGRGSAAVVLGESGIGKTRLLEELASIARSRGVAVAWARCPESGAIPPFWPITEISAQLFAEGVVDATLVPPLDTLGTGDTRSPHTLFELYQLVATAMRNSSVPMLAVIDDVQWADADSLRMLGHVAAELTHAPLLACISTRPLDDDSPPPLLDGLDALARSADSLHLQLDGLSAEAVADWLAARSDTVVAAAVADLVHRRTSGHPLFVKELSELLLAEGQLTESGLAEARSAIPPGVQFVVRRRVTRLTQQCQQLLTVAAVVGRTFDLDLVAALCDLDLDSALDALDPALAEGLVLADPSGTFRFSHALVAEALEAEVNHSRRARLHARAAQLLADRPDVGPEVVAHHAIEGAVAGSAELAHAASVAAARSADARLGYEDAASHWEQAVQALGRARPHDRTTRIDTLCAWSDALFRIDRVTEAVAAAVEALELAEVVGDLDSMVRAAGLIGHPHVWPHHAYGEVDPRVEAALRRTSERLDDTRQADRARVLGALALEITYGPDDEWEAAAADARAAARACGEPDVVARVLLNTSGDMAPSQIERRRADALAVIDLADAHHLHPELELIARFNLALCENEMGEIDTAAAQVARCTQIAERLGGSGAMAQLLWFEAQLEVARCRYDRAVELGRTADDLYRRTRGHDAELVAMVLQVALVADLGGFAAFAEGFSSAAGQSPAYADGTGHVLAWLALENGWPDLAGEIARSQPAAPQLPDDYTTLGFGCARLQLAASLGLADELASLMPQLAPYAGRWASLGSGSAVLGLVDHSLARGAERLGNLDEARHRYEAAVAGHERMRTPAWLARSLVHHARFLLTYGEPHERSAAVAALDRAAAIATEHGLEPIAHQGEQTREEHAPGR
jgi:DNA-binding SARP family transcriptional activator/tetratricopeptide (TPR) repeat protein